MGKEEAKVESKMPHPGHVPGLNAASRVGAGHKPGKCRVRQGGADNEKKDEFRPTPCRGCYLLATDHTRNFRKYESMPLLYRYRTAAEHSPRSFVIRNPERHIVRGRKRSNIMR